MDKRRFYGNSTVDYSKHAILAPLNFNPTELGLQINIIEFFENLEDANKRFIYLVDNTVSTTLLSNGTSYLCYQTIDDVETITELSSESINWTNGSIKRFVVVRNPATSIVVDIPTRQGAIWCYIGDFNVTTLTGSGGYTINYLKYIHCFNIDRILSIGDFSLNYWTGSIITIPASCISVGELGHPDFVNIKNGIKNIGSYFLYSRTSLKGINELHNIILPESVESIGGVSFADCPLLNGHLYIGANLNSVASSAFKRVCATIEINPSNIYFSTDGCGIYNKNKTFLYSNIGFYAGEWNIPNTVTSMRDWDCSGNIYITKLVIPNSLVTFGNWFCELCINLISIDIHNNVPPAILDSLPHSLYTTCTIHVPVGTLAAYQAASIWSNFTNIIDDL